MSHQQPTQPREARQRAEARTDYQLRRPRNREESRVLVQNALQARASSELIAIQAKPILNESRSKLYVLIFWLSLIAAYWWYTHTHQLEPATIVQQLGHFFAEHPLGPLVFITLFSIQPIVFFPTAAMGIASGTLYGPLLGVIYTLLGAAGASTVTYAIGYFFGRGVLNGKQASHFIVRYADMIRDKPFEAMLIMHLLFLPFDLVNYLGGLLRIDWRPFIMGTLVGSIPGVTTLVLLGTSVEGDMTQGEMAFNWHTVGIAALIYMGSLGLAHLIRRWRNS